MSKRIYLFLAFSLILTFLGCDNKNNEILKNKETIKLSKVLKQTSDYAGKSVVIDGNYFPACSSSQCNDDFTLRDGLDQIKVFTMGNFKFKSINNAQALRVSGILRETSQSPFIEATVIEKR